MKTVAEQQEEYRARIADGLWPDANVEERLRLLAEIERLTRDRDLWKERHDRERAAHAKNLTEQQKCELERAQLRIALDALLERYVDLVNCGDCGNWDPEGEGEVQQARAALQLVDAQPYPVKSSECGHAGARVICPDCGIDLRGLVRSASSIDGSNP